MALKIAPKRTHHSLKEKMEILKCVDEGMNAAELARKYGIAQSTISGWKKSRRSIEEYCDSSGVDTRRRTLKTPIRFKFSNELFQWFQEQTDKGVALSGPMIKDKAIELNRSLGGDPNFMASEGWISVWKNKFNIRWNLNEGKLCCGAETDESEIGSNTGTSDDRDREETSQGANCVNGTLQEAVNALREISDQNKSSSQFQAFAHHVAVQLEQLPLENALVLQSDIQNLITETRLKTLREQKSSETVIFAEEVEDESSMDEDLLCDEIDIKPEFL